MRPLELGLENFRSYFGDETVFSFRDRSLVGIVGPIGAGKSTILDAIAFALYGKTPSVGAATRSLIHQRATNAMVRLRFEVDGEIWEAVRRLRDKGQGVHALYRLAVDGPDQEPVERVTLEADVNAKIVELLGLEFDAFGRSVLLAQNRFAEFLRAKPVERDRVLKGVFGHELLDAMRETARARAATIEVRSREMGVRIEQVDRVAERLVGRRERRKLLEERLETLRQAEPTMADLESSIAENLRVRTEVDQRSAEIRGLADQLPDPAGTDRLLSEAEGADQKRLELAGALEDAQAKLAAADQALAQAAEARTPETIDRATILMAAMAPLERAARDAARRLADVTVRLEKLTAARQATESRVAAAEAAVGEAETALAQCSANAAAAEAEVLDIRHAEMAMSLRADLHAGEECPVCGQDVHDVPAIAPSADLDEAQAALDAAKSAQHLADERRVSATAEARAAREALTAAEAETARLEVEHGAAAEAAAGADQEHSRASADLTDLLGGADHDARLQALKAEQAELHDAAGRARKAVERARADHDAAIRDQQEVTKRLSALRVDLAGVAAKLGIAIEMTDDAPATLRGAVAELRSAWSATSKELAERGRRASEAEADARRERERLVESLAVGDDFAAALAEAKAETEMLAKSIADDEAELAGAAALVEERDQLEASRARFHQIASDLTDSRFVRYLLDDEKTRLAALGSEHFQRLSSGRYRFSEDGKFEIVDLTAAEAVRKAESLSGGETFLASLGLALALAEMVSRTGGRLDAFFIDEGFGSLDPEHLDLAMEGIEVLASDSADRLVVVVSHVPELRHRIEDLIELDRSPTTGDTRVIRA